MLVIYSDALDEYYGRVLGARVHCAPTPPIIYVFRPPFARKCPKKCKKILIQK